MSADNPFRPSFGKQPPLMAGRENQMSRMWSAMEAGPKSPDYAIVLTGIRGCGKTAFMSAMRAQARKQGWGVIKAQRVVTAALIVCCANERCNARRALGGGLAWGITSDS